MSKLQDRVDRIRELPVVLRVPASERKLAAELTTNDIVALIRHYEEWYEKDGNSPGYNKNKAVVYGKRCAELALELRLAVDDIGD